MASRNLTTELFWATALGYNKVRAEETSSAWPKAARSWTFITRSLAGSSLTAHKGLRVDLARWLAKARQAGLDDSITALFESTCRATANEEVA